MYARTSQSFRKRFLAITLAATMIMSLWLPAAPAAEAADGPGTVVRQYVVDKNAVVGCHNAVVENDGSPGKAGQLKNGSSHYAHRSYLSFVVPVEGLGEIESVKLKLTPLAAKANTKLGVYAGPASDLWPTSNVGMKTATDLPDVAERADHNCPSGANALLGEYRGAVELGEAIEVDLGDFITGAGTYNMMLRGIAGEEGDYTEYLSKYRTPPAEIDNTDNRALPQLEVTYTSEQEEPSEPAGPPEECTVTIPRMTVGTGGAEVPHSGQLWGAAAGAVICVEGGPRDTQLLLVNMAGNADNPVRIISYNGVVELNINMGWNAPIDIRNSKHFILDGLADPHTEYGFKLTNLAADGHGLQIGRLSTDYMIQGVEIAQAGFAGMMLRTEPGHLGSEAGPADQETTFAQQKISIRNNKITNIESAANGFGIFVGQGNFGANLKVHRTNGLRIHDNIISDVSRDGIRVFGAAEDVRVYGNSISDYAKTVDAANNNGILIGAGSEGYYYGNAIMGGETLASGAGINNQGRGHVSILNNLVIEPGLYGIASPASASSLFPEHPLFGKDLPSSISYNTIIHPAVDGHGIMLRSSENEAAGNTVDHNLIVHRSGSVSESVYQTADSYPVTIADNYDTSDLTEVQFADADAASFDRLNYALQEGSPAEGKGFMPGVAIADDVTYSESTGWLYEEDETEEPEVPSLDPEFDYASYVPDPVDLTCDLTIPSNATRGWDGVVMGAEPGDIVCIEGGLRPEALRLVNFHGTEDEPITFVNQGNVVTIVTNTAAYGGAVKISASSHVRLTGTGDRNAQYGFRFKSAGTGMMGVVADSLSTDIEVDHVEVFGAGFAGIMMKSDPVSNDPSAWRENFTMTGLKIHHNYIRDVDGEGMYIGNTSYHNGVQSNGVTVWPHSVEGLYVHDNIMERTGWDGIQVASATQDVAIYNNIIRDYGTRKEEWQDNGLQIGPGSTGAYYNNVIVSGKGNGSGINNQGRGNQIFYNNLIVDAKGSGIISLERINSEMDEWAGEDNPIYFIQNTIVNPGAEGIYFWNTTANHTGSAAYNNIIVKDGSASTEGLITLNSPSNSELALGGNLLSTSIEDMNFVNPGEGDYSLTADSPAVDTGIDLDGFQWAVAAELDLADNDRPARDGYDAGAFELQAEAGPTPTDNPVIPTPTPTDNQTTPSPSPTPTPTQTPTPLSTYAPQPMPNDSEKHWSVKAVKEMADLGALVLEKDGSFKPDKKASRAEFIDMLVKAAGLQSDDDLNTFKDTANHWAQESIAIAAALGLVNGYDESTFGPDKGITREGMAVIVARALNLPTGANGGEGTFKDGQSVSHWARDAVTAAAKLGLLHGYPDGSFQPKRELSRAEAATIILRIREHLERMKKEE